MNIRVVSKYLWEVPGYWAAKWCRRWMVLSHRPSMLPSSGMLLSLCGPSWSVQVPTLSHINRNLLSITLAEPWLCPVVGRCLPLVPGISTSGEHRTAGVGSTDSQFGSLGVMVRGATPSSASWFQTHSTIYRSLIRCMTASWRIRFQPSGVSSELAPH